VKAFTLGFCEGALVVIFALASGISMAAVTGTTIRTLPKMVPKQQATKRRLSPIETPDQPARTSVIRLGIA
jgi:hypothetical protein